MMYGTIPSAVYLIVYMRNDLTYYLHEYNDDMSALAWTQKQKKAKKFSTQTEASRVIADIKTIRDDKKLPLTITQVGL